MALRAALRHNFHRSTVCAAWKNSVPAPLSFPTSAGIWWPRRLSTTNSAEDVNIGFPPRTEEEDDDELGKPLDEFVYTDEPVSQTDNANAVTVTPAKFFVELEITGTEE